MNICNGGPVYRPVVRRMDVMARCPACTALTTVQCPCQATQASLSSAAAAVAMCSLIPGQSHWCGTVGRKIGIGQCSVGTQQQQQQTLVGYHTAASCHVVGHHFARLMKQPA